MRKWFERMMLKIGFAPQKRVEELEESLQKKTLSLTSLRRKLNEAHEEREALLQQLKDAQAERAEILQESGLEARWALRAIHQRADQFLGGVSVR